MVEGENWAAQNKPQGLDSEGSRVSVVLQGLVMSIPLGGGLDHTTDFPFLGEKV